MMEPQNGWGCQGSLEAIWSNPVLKQRHPELAAQDYICVAFEDL